MINAWEVIPKEEGWAPLIQGHVPPGTTPKSIWVGVEGRMYTDGQRGSMFRRTEHSE